MAYWMDERRKERSLEAETWTKHMAEKYADEIVYCVQQTTVYGGPDRLPREYKAESAEPPAITVIPADTVSALFERPGDEKLACLNFADYQKCGGGFLSGMHAQEEALCSESFLFNVLASFENSYYAWNNMKGSNGRFQNLNKELYLNRALYSPGVVFENRASEHPAGAHIGESVKADVLTCASPNIRHGKASAEENSAALRSRIRFIVDVLNEHDADSWILGAYGCGVFKQDPEEVARLFRKTLLEKPVRAKRVIFAIPSKSDKPNRNFEVFSAILGNS